MKKYMFIVLSIVIASFITLDMTIKIKNRSRDERVEKSLSIKESQYSKKSKNSNSNETTTQDKRDELTIIFSGDTLVHDDLRESFNIQDKYYFNRAFEEIEKEFEEIDYHIANVETTFNTKREPSGYPAFNSPVEILDDLKELKVDTIITSHNHILDADLEGLEETLKSLDEANVNSLGVGDPTEEKWAIYEKNNIKVGVIAYTYGTNLGQAYPEYINYIDEELIKEDLQKLKNIGCDFVITYLHIGDEYNRDIEDYQQELVDELIESGADAIICSHAHVPRKSEVIEYNNKNVYVNYGMGNFLSNQNDVYSNVGTLSKLTIKKDAEGNVFLKEAQSIPVYRLRYGEFPTKVYKMILVENMEDYDDVINRHEIEFINRVAEEIKLYYQSE